MLLCGKYIMCIYSFVQSLQEHEGGRDFSPLVYPGRLAEEVTLRWTESAHRLGSGGGHIRQVVSMEALTGWKVQSMSGEWCIITHIYG